MNDFVAKDLNHLFFGESTFSCVPATDSTLLCADGNRKTPYDKIPS